MKRILAILAAVAVPLLMSSSGTAQEPRVAPVPPAVDSAFDAQKAAFLALPLATRKVAQDGLVWLGFYNGSSDGEFGKRTRDSIVAWQRSQKQAGDGVLSQGQIQVLLAAAQKARAAVGFETIDDAKTGARIGAPRKLMAPDGAKLDFVASADVDLAALYARLSADTPTRKVAYKAMKPNGFFVVSGQDGETKFYARYERNESASPPIRGFTFFYPAARAAQFDRIAIAVANSFEAFRTRAEGGATAPATTPGAAASNPNPPPGPIATAFAVGPGRALTALKPDDCANPIVDGKPARFERTDAKTGLAILSGDFAPEGKLPGLGALAPDLIALSYGGARVSANSASLGSGPGRPFVLASLEKSARGAPLFDRRGGLVGVVAPIGQDPKRIAGVALAVAHPIVEPQAVGAFLGGVSSSRPQRRSPPARSPNARGGLWSRCRAESRPPELQTQQIVGFGGSASLQSRQMADCARPRYTAPFDGLRKAGLAKNEQGPEAGGDLGRRRRLLTACPSRRRAHPIAAARASQRSDRSRHHRPPRPHRQALLWQPALRQVIPNRDVASGNRGCWPHHDASAF
jgi:hypothetical protein